MSFKSWITGVRRPSSGSGPFVIVCVTVKLSFSICWDLILAHPGKTSTIYPAAPPDLCYGDDLQLNLLSGFLKLSLLSLTFFRIFKNLVGIKIKTFLLVSWTLFFYPFFFLITNQFERSCYLLTFWGGYWIHFRIFKTSIFLIMCICVCQSVGMCTGIQHLWRSE